MGQCQKFEGRKTFLSDQRNCVSKNVGNPVAFFISVYCVALEVHKKCMVEQKSKLSHLPEDREEGGGLWVKNIQMKILELKNITHSSPYGLNMRMKVIEERLSEVD